MDVCKHEHGFLFVLGNHLTAALENIRVSPELVRAICRDCNGSTEASNLTSGGVLKEGIELEQDNDG